MDSQTLGFGFTFADLAERDGLIRLDRRFLGFIAERAPDVHARLLAARAEPDALGAKPEADLILALGPELEAFLAGLFGIEAEIAALAGRTHALDPIHDCKRLFVQRQAVKKYPDPSGFDGAALRAGIEARLGGAADRDRFRQCGRSVAERRGCDRPCHALRRLGDADGRRQGGASGRHAVPRAASHGLRPSGAGGDDRARRRDDAAPARA